MIILTRGIDLWLDQRDGTVSWGGSGRADFSGTLLRLWVSLEGPIDRRTGFLVNVAQVSEAFKAALEDRPIRVENAGQLFDWAREVVRRRFGDLTCRQLRLELNRKSSLSWRQEDEYMIQLTNKYEIAASHTLKCEDWDRQRNLEVFGKCANPRGHGHNYTVEITVGGKPDKHTGRLAEPELIDRQVKEWIIDRFDHKNLNEDTPEFAELNPTVENMARVFWELLYGRFGAAQLNRVRVWETQKTYADYYGEDAGSLRDKNSV